MRKISYHILITVIFYLTAGSLWSQVVTNVQNETALTNRGGGLEFKYLSKLQSGLAVSWVVYSDSDPIREAKRKERFYWVGTFDAFTFTNISIKTSKDGKVVEGNTNVWGRRNGTRWQATSYEEGILDVNSNPTEKEKQVDNAMLYPLTNVLTMGFGLHWDVSSMRFLAKGKVTGKAANFPDSLEGQITYLPNGQVQQFFYSIPSLGKSYLLTFSYRIGQEQFPSGFELWLAGVLPSGEPYAALLRSKYEILSISDITPEVAKLAGVPPSSLSKNALITNGVTIASSPYALTPEAIGTSQKTSSSPNETKASQTVIIRAIILVVFLLPLPFVIFAAFKKRNSK